MPIGSLRLPRHGTAPRSCTKNEHPNRVVRSPRFSPGGSVVRSRPSGSPGPGCRSTEKPCGPWWPWSRYGQTPEAAPFCGAPGRRPAPRAGRRRVPSRGPRRGAGRLGKRRGPCRKTLRRRQGPLVRDRPLRDRRAPPGVAGLGLRRPGRRPHSLRFPGRLPGSLRPCPSWTSRQRPLPGTPGSRGPGSSPGQPLEYRSAVFLPGPRAPGYPSAPARAPGRPG
ncbi:MAG: hypothetical protein MZU97_12435 [Bacillus subtilis]|nr:hypothetical protein [Bacillus subtilis]